MAAQQPRLTSCVFEELHDRVHRHSKVYCPGGTWPSLLSFLSTRFPVQGRAVWQARMAQGWVRSADGNPLGPESAYTPERMVHYWRDVPDEVDSGLREHIVYQDDHLVVADKPHGMPVTPGGVVLKNALLTRLQARLCAADLQPLHRIDSATAGLVLFGRNRHERAAFHTLFAKREMRKKYLASARATDAQWATIGAIATHRISRIEPDPAHFMRMQEMPGAPNSHTRVLGLRREDGVGHFALEPVTGKRHQLRVHMAAMGMPLMNDRIYPELLPQSLNTDALPPLQLLAFELSFKDPITGQAREFQSQLQLLST